MKTLKKISLKSASVLDDKQLKQIYGGSGHVNGHGTCGWISYKDATMKEPTSAGCNVSKDVALFMLGNQPGYWCCDSCSETFYCGD